MSTVALIRALAIHIPSDLQSIDALDRVVEIISKLTDSLSAHGINPWTLRVIFPATSAVESLRQYLSDLFSVVGNSVLVAIGVEEDAPDLNKMLDFLSTYNNLYSSVRCSTDYCVEKIVSSVYMRGLGNVELEVFTKFAVLYGQWVETPYLPATSNISDMLGMSVSFRYIDLIDKALTKGEISDLINFINEARRALEAVSKSLNMPLLGFDLSISPWKNESVAMLIEKLIGGRIGFPGTINAIYSLNRMVRGLAEKLQIRCIGFNEVMLSVAEDDVLNERVKEGEIRLRDLIGFSLVCAAGLDMVAVPRTLDLYRVAVDVLTSFKIKRRSIAMRIIPVDGEPGSEVKLKGFGTTYVARP